MIGNGSGSGGFLAVLAAGLLLPAGAGAAEGAPDFQRDPALSPPGPPEGEILPILSDRCFRCHGPDEANRKAGLRFDVREGALRERKGKTAIVPGQRPASELWRRITSTDPEERMPPPRSNRSLSPREIETLGRWIDAGAPWGVHWAFVPPVRPEPPAVHLAEWPRNGLDRFILERLEAEGLEPSPEAPAETLVRRVTLDLTGLPPTPEEVDRFLADGQDDALPPRSPGGDGAYQRLVDRLLASPRYGERMVWEWLDAARYADTNGYQGDPTRSMWPWRDWAIGALNSNLPFDRFTVEQLAGDLLPGAGVSQRLATGFHRNHALNGEGGRIPEESRVDYVVDRVDTTATVWLGLTLGCARCHDHKFDPFSQKEYYRLYAYFNNLPESGATDEWPNAKPTLALPTPEQAARIAALEREVEERKRELAAAASGPPPAELKEKLAEAEKALKDARAKPVRVMVMQEAEKPRESFVLLRGAYDKPGEKVRSGVPAALSPALAERQEGPPSSRLDLARWLMDPAHPLTARVTVNRYWQLFFGSGIVKTVEDFGVQGERPSHPRLLDWLAAEFVSSGWDVKRLHRLIVTSATYRQSSRATATLLEKDPENRLLARGPRFRLSSAALRDQALAVSGLLVEKLGGPPVKPYQPPGVWEEMTFGQIKYAQDKGESLYRRSLYTFWRRTVAPTTLFDTASRQTCTVRQARTNSPLHALALLNDVTYVEAARKLAERVLLGAAKDDGGRLAAAFRLATARHPEPGEHAVLSAALERLRKQAAADPEGARKLVESGESPRDASLDPLELAAWTGISSLILNLDETITRE